MKTEKAISTTYNNFARGLTLGKLIRAIEETRRLLDESLKIVDEQREKGGEVAELYDDYRADLREMYSKLYALMGKMYADRVLDPEERKAVALILEAETKRM